MIVMMASSILIRDTQVERKCLTILEGLRHRFLQARTVHFLEQD